MVATNVAETSLTIDGVKIVIDSGLARIARFDKSRGINTLRIEKISQSSALQRAGRAGRSCPGKCYRLWSEGDHAAREVDLMPELLRLDLSEVLLLLLVADINPEVDLKWVDLPPEESLTSGGSMLRRCVCANAKQVEVLPALEEGLLMGGSSGINVAGAIRLAKELGPGKTIVTILCDSGSRYQSKLYNPEFLTSEGLPLPPWLTA